MKYISTRNSSESLPFESVFIKGLADDGGLFLPEKDFKFEEKDLSKLQSMSYYELATEIVYKFTGDFIEKDNLYELVKKSYLSFRSEEVVKLRKVGNFNILELFHGPTLAFKDIAMQLIGNFYEYYLSKNKNFINIIVATSGDTGAAAIDAIKGKKNLNIFVLHPHNRISSVQRRIMSTVKEKNVFNIAIKGNFDDCQNLVKAMFVDQNFSKKINMSGVNSINWARIVAQTVYYFFCFFSLKSKKLNFSVPTGNFGDIYAGYLAKKMGLPIDKLIVATNQNDILHRAISKGDYTSKKVSETFSPSMDIQLASNFERLIFEIQGCNSDKTKNIMAKVKENNYKLDETSLNKINKDFLSEKLSEDETINEIKEVFKNHNIVLDPHTAIGYGVAKKLKQDNSCIILSTAHPSKFPEAIKNALGKNEELPPELRNVLKEKEKFEILENSLDQVKNYILKKIDENKN